jgi:preprotein translocase subunit SecE
MMEDSGRVELKDKKFTTDIADKEFINKFFLRLVAKGIKFSNINFRYCIFDASYLRNCNFDSCDFTGCRFVGGNFVGSSFTGCKFDYATFDKTFIDNDILDQCCPSPENLKLKFARSLRVNYQQLGDAISANKAIGIELRATEDHLLKGWKSKEAYYRKKYQGFARFKEFFKWVNFKLLDVLWGNGESTLKLFRTIFVMLICMSIYHVISDGNPNLLNEYSRAFLLSPQILLGVVSPESYTTSYLTFLFVVRLILFGFFMSIIIKRFNRR